MSEIVSTTAYRRLRAPRQDGEALFAPPVADEAAFLQQNIALREQTDCDIRGCSLSQLRAVARRDLLQLASDYTRAYRDVPAGDLDPNAPVILVGHQPELVHPGVWFKNFLLSEFARRTGSQAVNLLIDNDAVRSTSIRVPGGSLADPLLSSIAFDSVGDPIPYEARAIEDPTLFASFAQRVERTIAPLVTHPLVARFWPHAVAAGRQHGNLGRALAQARHILEEAWGLSSLELPLSSICDTQAFRFLTAHLLADATRLREIHNACVAQYRRVNRVRSHSHPVPDLVRDGEWIEVPFWLWSQQHRQRRPAFVRRRADQVHLSDRQNICLTLDLGADVDAAVCVEQLADACHKGIRVRPRALITTMFARLVLSDIFIHGIGGAKYDQVTDAIVRRFFAIEPPEYLVATATLKLPVPHTVVEPQDLRRVKRQLRELRYHPELHVDETAETLPLIREKRRWIGAQVPADRLRERHVGICRVNETLQVMLTARRDQLQNELGQLRSLLRQQAILGSREYAFCLFPAKSLRDRLLDLSRQ